MSTILQDVRYAVRALMRQPGFAAIVVITLAVGLGANAAVFGVVDALLLRPMPIPNIDRIVQIFAAKTSGTEMGDERESVSPADFLDWRQSARSFEHVVAIEWWWASLTNAATGGTSGTEPERIIAHRVSTAFFRVLGVQPASGRAFLADEETEGRNRVAVVSDRLWRRRWATTPSLVGSTVMLESEPYTVVGIAPPGFSYPSGTDVWVPLAFDAKTAAVRNRRYLHVLALLSPGSTHERASQEMIGIAARLEREHPQSDGGYGVNVMPFSRALIDEGTPEVVGVWQVAVTLVLLIAGANVANLLLVRGASRRKELALRLAIGASRWRVVRQLVVESVVLSIAGAALAVPFAWVGLRLIRINMPPEVARFVAGWDKLAIHGRLLAVTALLSVVAGIVFGVVPALRASRPDLTDALKEGARGSGGGRNRLLHGFVVVQVALALSLLVAAGLSVQGALRLLFQNDGYDPIGVMTFSLTLPQRGYPDDSARMHFYERALDRTRGLPEVVDVGFTNFVPFSFGNARRLIEVEGRPITNASERPDPDMRTVTPEFFRTIHTPIRRGRGFRAQDRAGAPVVAIVNEIMASRLWPGLDPIGRRFRPMHVANEPWLTVVGVCGNVKHEWWFGYRPTYYVPLAQSTVDYATLLVRVRSDEAAVVPMVREVMRQLDASLPLADVRSLAQWRRVRSIGIQYVAALMAAFGAIGLFLAAVGIYGVMAYSVNQRTRELGVRIALGATGSQVMGMTLRQALVLSLVGITVGSVAAFALARVMVSTLFGVIQMDVVMFVAFAVMLLAVALVASGVPARRAMRVDPIAALRAE